MTTGLAVAVYDRPMEGAVQDMDSHLNFERFSKKSDNMSLEKAKQEANDIQVEINGKTDSEDEAVDAIAGHIALLDQNWLAGGRDEGVQQDK